LSSPPESSQRRVPLTHLVSQPELCRARLFSGRGFRPVSVIRMLRGMSVLERLGWVSPFGTADFIALAFIGHL
jgi:hypothetical protein